MDVLLWSCNIPSFLLGFSQNNSGGLFNIQFFFFSLVCVFSSRQSQPPWGKPSAFLLRHIFVWENSWNISGKWRKENTNGGFCVVGLCWDSSLADVRIFSWTILLWFLNHTKTIQGFFVEIKTRKYTKNNNMGMEKRHLWKHQTFDFVPSFTEQVFRLFHFVLFKSWNSTDE